MKRSLLAILCVLIAESVLNAQDPASGFASRLRDLSGKTQSIECGFTLTRTATFLAEPTVSEGKFFYLRDAGISLEFTQPEGDLITMGREKFRIVSAGRTNITPIASNPMLKQMQRMLEACFTGDIAMLETGYSVSYSEGTDSYTVVMEPQDKRARKYTRRITLIFDKKDMSLISLIMEEGSGDVSEYHFFDKKINGEVGTSHFEIQ